MAVKFVSFILVLPLCFCWFLTINAQLSTVPNVNETKTYHTALRCDNDTDCTWIYNTHCVDHTCVCVDGYVWNYNNGVCYPKALITFLWVCFGIFAFVFGIGLVISICKWCCRPMGYMSI